MSSWAQSVFTRSMGNSRSVLVARTRQNVRLRRPVARVMPTVHAVTEAAKHAR